MTECWTDSIGRDYRGTVSKASNGVTCKKWTDEYQNNNPGTGLGRHNFCRNPDNDIGGVWCFIIEYHNIYETNWAFCNIGNRTNSCGRLRGHFDLEAIRPTSPIKLN